MGRDISREREKKGQVGIKKEKKKAHRAGLIEQQAEQGGFSAVDRFHVHLTVGSILAKFHVGLPHNGERAQRKGLLSFLCVGGIDSLVMQIQANLSSFQVKKRGAGK